MTAVRSVDGNNDWQFGKGRNDYKRNQLAVAQNIKTRLQSFLGDCFFDEEAGIDWFNLLGAKNQLALELAISSTILNTENVTGLLQLNIVLDPVTRNLLIQYACQTIFSATAISDEFIFDVGGL
jgi:hypothetical protein